MIDELRSTYRKGDTGKIDDIIASIIVTPEQSPQKLVEAATVCEEYLDFSSAYTLFEHLLESSNRNNITENRFATLLIQMGKFEEARERLLKLLEIDSNFGQTYFNLAQIYRATPDDPLIAAIENRLKKSPLEKSDEYPCRLALGKLYDDIGEFDLAFSQFRTAKNLPAISYPHDAQIDYFDRVKATYSKTFMTSNVRHDTTNEKKAIFLVGMPRSGSTLLEQLLGEYHGIEALGERAELALIIRELGQENGGGDDYLSVLQNLSGEKLRGYGDKYFERTNILAPTAVATVDKNLTNFLRTGFIDAAVKNAVTIECVRDPIDTCLSCYFQALDPANFAFSFDLTDLGNFYAGYASLMEHWQEVCENDVIQIAYESVVTDTQTELQRITDSIPATSDAQEDINKDIVIKTSSAWQARQPVYDASIGRWKNYEKHLSPLIAALQKNKLV